MSNDNVHIASPGRSAREIVRYSRHMLLPEKGSMPARRQTPWQRHDTLRST